MGIKAIATLENARWLGTSWNAMTQGLGLEKTFGDECPVAKRLTMKGFQPISWPGIHFSLTSPRAVTMGAKFAYM